MFAKQAKIRNKKMIIAILLVVTITFSVLLMPIKAQTDEEGNYFFSIHMMTFRGRPESEKTVIVLKEEFAKIGIEVTYDTIDGTVWNDRGFKTALELATHETGGYDLHLGQYGLGSPRDPDSFGLTMSSEGRWPGGWNWWLWSNADVDDLYDAGRVLLERDERQAIYSQIQEITVDVVAPVIPIVFMKISRMMSSDLEGYNPVIGTNQGTSQWILDGQSGGTFRYGGTRDPVSLLPWWGNIGADNFARDIYESLVNFDENKNVVPELAKSWEYSEDGLTYTFHLNEGVTWHDGVPFTADDVVFTYEGILDKTSGTTMWSRVHQNIASIEKVDDHTVTFHLNDRNAGVFSTVFFPVYIIPKHIMEDVPLADWKHSDQATSSPIGTGPYKFIEWVPEQYITLEAYDDYYIAGEPNFDERISIILPDAATALAALQNGDIDYLSNTGYTVDQLALVTDDPNIKVINELRDRSLLLGVNLAHPILNNMFVRKAMSSAIPREKIANEVLEGLAIPATSIWNELHWWWDSTLELPGYDIDQAKAYMEMAGYNFEHLEPDPTTPISQNLVYAVIGLIAGLAIGFVGSRYLKS